MAYVQRDPNGNIIAVFANIQDGIPEEWVDNPIVYEPPLDPSTLTLTPRQIRLVLNAASLRTQVDNAVAAADQNTKDMWEYSSIFLRTDPILNSVAISLGFSSSQLDALFEQGQSL